jgi:hypothetical protein
VGDRRTQLEIRTIVASFKSAEQERDDSIVRVARQRANRLLDRVAMRIDAERDEELAALLRDARREVAEPPPG